MATHSGILAWRILCTEEPGGLQSMGSHRKKQKSTRRHGSEEVLTRSLKSAGTGRRLALLLRVADSSDLTNRMLMPMGCSHTHKYLPGSFRLC